MTMMTTLNRTFAILVPLLLMTTLIPTLAPSAHAQGEDMMAMTHYNMKSGDDLSLQVAAEGGTPEQKEVEADYDPYHGFPGGRANKRWVTVGTWESQTKSKGTFHLNGSVVFNLWVSEIDEGFTNSCDFEFRLSIDGTTVVTATTSTVTTTQPSEVRTNPTGEVKGNITPETTLTLTIRYSGWEDINVFWDSYDRDSGFRIDMDPIRIISWKTGKDTSSVTFGDRFGADWFASAYASRIYLNGNETPADHSVMAKGTFDDPGQSIPVYEIIWSGYDNPDGLPVSIGLSYSRIVDPADSTSWYLEGSSGKAKSDNNDEILGMDRDDAMMVFSGVGVVLIVLVVVFLILRKRRMSDNDDDDDEGDEDEYPDEDEFDDEDDDESGDDPKDGDTGGGADGDGDEHGNE